MIFKDSRAELLIYRSGELLAPLKLSEHFVLKLYSNWPMSLVLKLSKSIILALMRHQFETIDKF